jgi:DegV family protein with EDD domain
MASSQSATEARPTAAVVTDTAACIPLGLQKELGIVVAPLTLVLDGIAYDDGALGAHEFYQRLKPPAAPPTTAGVSPQAFLEAYRTTGASSVLCVTVSSRFSATHANALIAAREAADEGIEVRVLDSEYATMAQGFVALAAAREAAAGARLDEVEASARRVTPQVGLVMMLEGLDHLARGGRVPRVAAWASSLLQVKPLVEFRDREIKLASRARTRKRALESLVGLLELRVGKTDRLHLAVHHANADEDARWLAEQASSRLKPVSLAITEFTQVMTAHVGPGIAGYAYWRET